VAAFYRARVTGMPAVLDPVQSFGDYALGKTRATAANESWWKEAYATLPRRSTCAGTGPVRRSRASMARP
jgi:hypothetical protein